MSLKQRKASGMNGIFSARVGMFANASEEVQFRVRVVEAVIVGMRVDMIG